MKLKIGGMVLTVQEAEMEEYGRFDHEKEKIFLRAGMDGLARDRTLLHEIIHVIWSEYDMPVDPVEESCVKRLESGLTSFIMDNPKEAMKLVERIAKLRRERT